MEAGLVQNWPSFWTKDWLLLPLTPEKHALLRQGVDERNPELLLTHSEFKPIMEKCSAYLNDHKAVFVRLGSLSPKDVLEPGPKCVTLKQIFTRLTESFRCLEDLEDAKYTPCTLVLRQWDDRMTRGVEYRCILFEGKLEEKVTNPEPDVVALQAIREFIAAHGGHLPSPHACLDLCLLESEVIFIEWNALDAELDIGKFDQLSLEAQAYINSTDLDFR
jgi:hypothetical protein